MDDQNALLKLADILESNSGGGCHLRLGSSTGHSMCEIHWQYWPCKTVVNRNELINALRAVRNR